VKAIRSTALACALLGAASVHAQTIPSDPMQNPDCVVSQSDFAGWFASGTPTVNGVVKPANSIQFQPSSNCAFYKWSEQMFMWLTSPAPSSYGGSGPVFNSNAFYQVVSASNGSLVFLPNPSNSTLKFGLRAAQAGAHNLPVMLDSKNVLHEIKPTPKSKSGKQMIPGANGQLVEIASAKFVAGKPVLLDAKGKQIKPQLRAMLAPRSGQPSFVEEIKVGNRSVFFDESGFPIDTDQGQAGGSKGVLVGQNGAPINGSLVYYATFTNDVFAYYLTQVKNANGGKTPPNTFFPTSAQDLAPIVAYAQAHGVKFPDPEALAIEVKTSWVQVNGPNPSQYVSLQGVVPTYTPSADGMIWKATGNYKAVTLALVGIHVVGSLTNHPEMAWSTFELFGSAPNAAYQYVNNQNQTIQVPQSTTGNWLFCQTNCQGPFNVQLANYKNPPNITAATTAPIAPSNTLRQKAFGAAYGTAPNAGVTSDAQSNSEVITTNDTVLNQILNGDVRRNYYMIGSTWTTSGAVPNGAYSPQTPNNTEIGTSQLQNVTMETYQQGSSNTWSPTTNCFGCHNQSTNPTKTTVEVSHIWPYLLSLFPPSN